MGGASGWIQGQSFAEGKRRCRKSRLKTAIRPQRGTFGSPRTPSESSAVLVPAQPQLSACVLNRFHYEDLGARAPRPARELTSQFRSLLNLLVQPLPNEKGSAAHPRAPSRAKAVPDLDVFQL